MGKIGKATKGINVEKNNNRFKKLKNKILKRKTPKNCKSPMLEAGVYNNNKKCDREKKEKK